MKYAAIVLFNNRNTLAAVDYLPVTEALLAGGVFLGELAFLPYDEPSSVSSALSRLSAECDGVFVIADRVLFGEARRMVEDAAAARFSEEYLLEGAACLFAMLPADMGGAEVVKDALIPRIDKRRRTSYFRVVLRTVGAPADLLRSSAKEAGKGGIDVHVSEKYGTARVELLYDRATPKYAVDEASRILASALDPYLYALEDVTVQERLVEALRVRRRHISVAESFTGGGVAKAIVSVPGASEVYFEGLNPYNALAKSERLGVKEATVKQQGTVSDQTAYEMAVGLLKGGHCDLAVATTGISGPGCDEKGNPVGLCYIAAGTREQVNVYCFHLTGDRKTISETAINLALFLAFKELK